MLRASFFIDLYQITGKHHEDCFTHSTGSWRHFDTISSHTRKMGLVTDDGNDSPTSCVCSTVNSGNTPPHLSLHRSRTVLNTLTSVWPNFEWRHYFWLFFSSWCALRYYDKLGSGSRIKADHAWLNKQDVSCFLSSRVLVAWCYPGRLVTWPSHLSSTMVWPIPALLTYFWATYIPHLVAITPGSLYFYIDKHQKITNPIVL